MARVCHGHPAVKTRGPFSSWSLRLLDSIFARDFPIVQGVILFLALTKITCNFVVDIAYAFLDPRIRYS